MRRCLAVAVMLSCLASWARAEVQVRVQADASRLDVTAQDAPLNQILDRIAEKTGMVVEYGESRPSQAVTATLRDLSPAAAVLAVLEGQRLNYALVMDRDGQRIQRLLLLGEAPASSAARAASTQRVRQPPPPIRRMRPTPMPDDDEEELEEPELEEDDGEAEVPAEAGMEAAPGLPAPAQGSIGFRRSFPRSTFTPGLPSMPSPPPVAPPSAPAPPEADEEE
jgi:hypothetical protein